MKSIGSRGTAPISSTRRTPSPTTTKGLIYVADRGNNRIQVYDPDLNRKAIFSNARAVGHYVRDAAQRQGEQFLYSADAGGKIYKLSLDGKLLAQLVRLDGQKVGQFYWVHQMHCVSGRTIITGEAQNWRVQRLTLKPTAASTK